MNDFIFASVFVFFLFWLYILFYKKKNEAPKTSDNAEELPDFSEINEACGRDISPDKRNNGIYKRGCADNKGLKL